jgi:hypothetical protein
MPASPAGASSSPSVHPPEATPCTCVKESPVHHRFRQKRRTKPVQRPPPPAPVVTALPPGTPLDAQVGELNSALVSILGKRVQGPKGEDLGRVVDLLADSEGRVRVAIIDFGGFLGVGTRRIAVDWPLLHFEPGNEEKPVRLDVNREKLQSAPEFKDSRRPRVLMPPDSAAATADAPPAPK